MEIMQSEDKKLKEEIIEIRMEFRRMEQSMKEYKGEVEVLVAKEIKENIKGICETIRDTQKEMIKEVYKEAIGETVDEMRETVIKEVVELMKVDKERMGDLYEAIGKIKKDMMTEERIGQDVKEMVHRQLRINEPIMTNIISDKIMDDVKELITPVQGKNKTLMEEKEPIKDANLYRGRKFIGKQHEEMETREETREQDKVCRRYEGDMRMIHNTNLYQRRKNDYVREENRKMEPEERLPETRECEDKRKERRQHYIETETKEEIIKETIKLENERRQRLENVMIFGAEERMEEEPDRREEADMIYCRKLINEGVQVDVNIRKVIRIGKRQENKKRPILVKLNNKIDRYLIMKNARNLANKQMQYKGISIAPDLSKDEREYRKQISSKQGYTQKRPMDRNLGSFIVNRSKRRPTFNNSNTSEDANHLNKECNTLLLDKTKGAISKRPMSSDEGNQNKSNTADGIY